MDERRRKIREDLKNKPPGASLSLEEIRELKEIENERVNRLIEEGGSELYSEYEAGLAMWRKLRSEGRFFPGGRPNPDFS